MFIKCTRINFGQRHMNVGGRLRQLSMILSFAMLFSVPFLSQSVLSQNSSPDPQPVTEGQSLVTLYSATFSGTKYTVQQDGNPATYASDGAGNVRSPEILQNQLASPLCYNWASTPSCTAVFNLNVSGSPQAQFKLNAVLASTGLQFSYVSQPYTLSGSSVTVSFPLELNGTVLPSRIDNTTFKETWLVSYDQGSTYTQIADTSNPLYVVAGVPGGGSMTNTRINQVTSDCRTNTSTGQIVNSIWLQEICRLPINPANALHPIWGNLDPGGNGQCIDIVTLMGDAIQMAGAGVAGNVVFCFPNVGKTAYVNSSPTAFVTRPNDIGQSQHTASLGFLHHVNSNNLEGLFYFDSQGNVENFEGCYLYNGVLYPGGTTSSSTYSNTTVGAVQLMTSIAKQTNWFWVAPSGGFVTCSPKMGQPNTGPGPDPQDVW